MKPRTLPIVGLVLLVLTAGPAAAVSDGYPYHPKRASTLGSIPDTDPIPYLAARDFRSVGDTANALKHSKLAGRNFPYHRPTFALRFRLLSEFRSDIRAREWARGQLKRTQYPELLNGLFDLNEGTFKEAVPLLVWSVKRNMATPEVVRYVSDQLPDDGTGRDWNVGDNDSRTRSPHSTELLHLRARLLARGGECTEAREIVRELVRRIPGRAEVHLLRARLIRQRQPERARMAYGRYRSLLQDSESVEPLDHGSVSCDPSD